MSEPAICGVYRITHRIVCGLSYVGSSINVNSRMRSHLHSLRRNCHSCKALQAAYNEHGEHAFSLEILELINDESALADRERYWTDALRDEVGGGFNRVTAGRHVAPIVQVVP
jgi:group I intron endonuclease